MLPAPGGVSPVHPTDSVSKPSYAEGAAMVSAMQMNRCRHLVPLYPYHATNYNYYNLITFTQRKIIIR